MDEGERLRENGAIEVRGIWLVHEVHNCSHVLEAFAGGL